ncbi:MAG: right-handed parallel beta-helix repeat-containing protein [Steroidobacteraceae bacterium]|jgi:parallel beta-helix repeat protein
MPVKNRLLVAAGVFVILGGVVALAHWYQSNRSKPQASAAGQNLLMHVTNNADRGPGTLREAIYLAAGAAAPATVSIEVPRIDLQSSLPPFVNAHGLRLIGTSPGVEINAGALSTGPVLDIAGPNVSVEGVSIQNCPAIAILVRAVHFHLASSLIQSCDVGVEVAENASDTLLERNRFAKDRLGVRFAAAGRNSVVASNEFVDDKDAGLWAVRSSTDARDAAITIRDNKFTEDGNAIVAGNIPVLIERNEFVNAHEAAVDLVGAGAVVRGNQINGGAAMGIVGESSSGAVIENNEIEGVGAYGIMLRRSSNMLVRNNRLNNCGYGLAFVLGDLKNVSHAVGNVIIEPKFNGIDVLGDSPTLSHNQVLRAHAYALHVDDFQPPSGERVTSHPYLEDNNFGSSPVKTAAMRTAP